LTNTGTEQDTFYISETHILCVLVDKYSKYVEDKHGNKADGDYRYE